MTTKGLLFGIRKLIFFISFLTIIVLIFFDGLDLGLRIPCDIFAFLASLSKIGFFTGIIVISAANNFPIIIKFVNN